VARVGLLAIFQLNLDGTICTPAAQFSEPTTLIPCLAQANGEALGQEGENVKDSGFATAVWSHKDSQWGEVSQLEILQGPVVFD